MKHIFIINKRNKSGLLEKRIYNACKYLNLEFKIVNIDNMEEMREQVGRYKYENNIIYACGGDGSINILLNELMGGKAKLGIIPLGTGNDFYRSLYEYKSDIVDVNVMSVNEILGINIFSLGIDSEICSNALKLKGLSVPNKYLYDLSVLYTFFKYKNQVMGINNFFEKRMLLAVCNGSYYGGGYKIGGKANIHNNEVYIVSVGDMPKFIMPSFWLEVIQERYEDNPYVELYFTDKDIHIETMYNLNGQLDGELIPGNEFHIRPHVGNIEVVNNRMLLRRILNNKYI